MKAKQLIAAMGLAATLGAQAQESAPPPKPTASDAVKPTMEANLGAMVSLLGPMTEAMVSAQVNAAAKPEVAEKLATFKRNLYDALLKKGFTAQQALQIVIATAPPSMAPTAK